MAHYLKRLLSPAVLLYQFMAVFVFIAAAVFSAKWMQLPFIGAFVEQTLIVNSFPLTYPGSWSLRENISGDGYQLKSINGVEVETSRQYAEQLSKYNFGETISLTLEASDGQKIIREILLDHFPPIARLTYVVIPYIIAGVYFLSGLWVLNLRRRDGSAQLYAIFTTSIFLAFVTLFDTYTSHNLSFFWGFSLAMAGGSLLSFSLLFPQEMPAVKRLPFLGWIGLPAALLVSAALPFTQNLDNPVAHLIAWQVIYIGLGTAFALFLVISVYRTISSPVPLIREQCKWLSASAALSLGPYLVWLLLNLTRQQMVITPYVMLPTLIFPLSVGYILLRKQVLTTDFLLRRSATYALLVILTVAGYSMLVSGGIILLRDVSPENNPYLLGAAVFLLAVVFNPTRSWLQNSIDGYFDRKEAKYRDIIDQVGKELTKASDLPVIVELVKRSVSHNLRPSHLHLFLYDPISEAYSAEVAGSDQHTTDLRFSTTSPLVQTLAERRSTIYLGDKVGLPTSLQSEKARLALLGAHLFVPLQGRERLIGWLALGSRSSGEIYNARDLTFFETISDQAALAIERAQVVANLERRMHEMNVLTRVSQGINVTLAFDDILELIYAQTYHVIPTLDFRVTLVDPYNKYLYHVFYLENDDRLTEKENCPLQPGQGLEQEIVNSGRAIITSDYARECRGRGVLPDVSGLFAWMGVPLNAGAETIGLISLGSHDPSTNYAHEQLNLLQAIADQAAGAIVKGRLLQESQRRARQLTFLNEVARSLTSTLDLDNLLNQILKNAVEILNCAAGGLLLTDKQTGELVYEVILGPLVTDLIGSRISSGTGLIGKAFKTQSPIVTNELNRTKEWLKDREQENGFFPQNLLIVPMVIKEEVIGVIEVINRKDGLPFTPDDQELLTAFTSQAAVAIENARLYTLTDQALAARVEELSVMQRIDRELNASLDVGRAMRITLSWAIRQSGAEAGLIGMVEENGIRVMASSGYSDELASYEGTNLPLSIPAIEKALESGQPNIVQISESESQSLLQTAKSVAALPIRREENAIGVLFLENTRSDRLSEEMLTFLSRLIDHATIAIANAQLYSAVEAANQAKSKFVSFVAHELKNPMASIKGYTELVAGGMAGPVNEMQSSFLATVNSNVDRMNTIVSDLNDLTKIEMGSLRLEFKPTEVKAGIEDVTRSLRRQIEDKALSVEMDLPETLPMVWADPNRLNQILTNLISNALKYTPQEGQVTIGAAKELNPVPTGLTQVVHIWITDTGIGIGPEDQDKIFQQYFRTNISKDYASGTGLGLHITKTLIEMQGGSIWFESELNTGTTFHFTVPIVEAD